jgi:4-amino-4-deoxy-L-arabinose transferase-like glycosyltransferase
MAGLPSPALIELEEEQLSSQAAQTIPSIENGSHLNRDTWLIFWAAALVFVLMPMPEFTGFQARFGLFAQEMFRCGPSWFPTTYHAPYPDYPATSILLIYLVARLFGQVTPFAAILPTAVASALILALTYRTGAIRSRKWGITAVLLALLTVEFLTASRGVALDQYTSLATVLSFYLVYSADCYSRRRRLWWLPSIGILGFAFRGPIGLVLPAAVVCIYYLWNRRFKASIIVVVSASFLLVACLVALLLAARAQAGERFMRTILSAQMTGRIGDKGRGLTYYWLGCFGSYAVSYPLAILVVVGRFKDIVRRTSDDDRLLGSLAAWALIILVGMSIPNAKKTRYVLPLVPALSLIGAYLLTASSPQGILLTARQWFRRFCSLCAPFAAVGVLGLSLYAWQFHPLWQAHYLGVLCLLLPLVLLARGQPARWSGGLDHDIVLLMIAVTTFVIVDIGIADPISYRLETTRAFVRQVEALHEKAPGQVVFFRVGPDQEDMKFMVNLSKPLEPRFARSLEVLRETPGTYYVIVKEKVLHTLATGNFERAKPVVRGRIGHEDFAVLRLNVLQPPRMEPLPTEEEGGWR